MKVAVIGAGPAGMTAAIAAADNGNEVVLFEKNEKIGKKLFITGKGRCNLTNASSAENIIQNTVTNPKFLYSALKNFGSEDTMRLIESAGVELKVERGNRVFPASDKSSDILRAFSVLLRESGVEVRLNEGVKNLAIRENRVERIVTEKGEYDDFQAVIVATGGVSYSATGSTGDGYVFAKKCGHNIVEPKPSLVGVYCKKVSAKKEVPFEKYNLSGISLKNVTISAFCKDKKIAEEFGEALYTEKGISGPIVLTLSAVINRYDAKDITLFLDMKPALSYEKSDERLLRDFSESPNRDIKTVMRGLVPSGLIPLYLDASGVSGDKKVNALTKEERANIVTTLKELKFSEIELEPIERAVVTSGGVSVKEIDAKSMKSKLIDNLYFVGEVLDVDALTGGYNIQIAMSTGYAAGSQIF